MTNQLATMKLVVYGGTGHHDFDKNVLRLLNDIGGGLNLEFSHCWHNVWPDGEPGFRLNEPAEIESAHVVIFACPITYRLESEMRDLVRGCAQQYGAKSVTLVLSFLRYRRQDRPEYQHEISRLRWFLWDLRHLGVTNLVLCEPHSLEHTRQYADEYDLKLFVADPTSLIAPKFAELIEASGGAASALVYSPDMGSVGRAFQLAKMLRVGVLASPKQRLNGEVTILPEEDFLTEARRRFGSGVSLSCDLALAKNKVLFMRDDELDSGRTAAKTANRLSEEGARAVHFFATHPVCSAGWKPSLFPHQVKAPFTTVWLGNTRPRGVSETPYEGSTGARVKTVSIEPVVAQALLEALKSLES